MGKKGNIVDFDATIENLEEVFNRVKKIQNNGSVNKRARINLNGMKVPVRYFDNYEQLFGAYEAITKKEYDSIIESLPDNLSKKDVFDLLHSCWSKHHYIMNAAGAKSLAEKYIENKKNRVTQKAKLQ